MSIAIIGEPSNVISLNYPGLAGPAPSIADSVGRYSLRLAKDSVDLDNAQRLRFEVFNLELQEGLSESYNMCRDVDAFDEHCHHLIVEDTRTHEIIGTYRMQTSNMSHRGAGFYCANEFNLEPLQGDFLPEAIELGRACIARKHRNNRVLFLLWRGLAAYMVQKRKRYFFGCCSLTSQNPVEGWHVMQYLKSQGYVDQRWHVNPTTEYQCYSEDFAAQPLQNKIKLPPLMKIYLDYGALIAGPPALDRQFGTIDYLAVFDINSISDRIRSMFID